MFLIGNGFIMEDDQIDFQRYGYNDLSQNNI